ncbi:MAG TPA: SiaC family regulatory phosphoprotein [Bacteroidia bacterium]|nr:SiaC family regulatory phosphoprotein [Bacteroidia bacterium]
MTAELFRLEETIDSPLVVIKSDSPHIMISGVSMPENSYEFYSPIETKALELLKDRGNDILIEIELSYLNSMSGKQLLQLIRKISYNHSGLKVVWKYKTDDDLMRIKGEDIKRICPAINIELVGVRS